MSEKNRRKKAGEDKSKKSQATEKGMKKDHSDVRNTDPIAGHEDPLSNRQGEERTYTTPEHNQQVGR